jgi:hypothetical protein
MEHVFTGNGLYTKEEQIFLLVSYLRLNADYTTIFADVYPNLKMTK